MHRAYGSTVAAVGGLIALVAFFLPWVEANFVALVLPLIQSAAGFINQELKALITQFAEYSSVTGLDLAFRLDFVTNTTRLIVLMPLLLAVIGLAAALLTILNAQLSRVVGSVLAVLATLTVATLVYNIPSFSRLGLAGNWLTSTALALLGFAPTAGFWGAVVGAVLIGVGGGLLLMSGSRKWSSDHEADDFYDPLVGN